MLDQILSRDGGELIDSGEEVVDQIISLVTCSDALGYEGNAEIHLAGHTATLTPKLLQNHHHLIEKYCECGQRLSRPVSVKYLKRILIFLDEGRHEEHQLTHKPYISTALLNEITCA